MSQQRVNAVGFKESIFPSFPRGLERSMSALPTFSWQQQRNVFFPRLMRKTLGVVSRPCERLGRWVRSIGGQPMVAHTVLWTSLLALLVTIGALSLEMGFSSVVSSHAQQPEDCALHGSLSVACKPCYSLPLDGPDYKFCVPALRFKKSKLDLVVPPIFAGLVVSGSALLVQTLDLFVEIMVDSDSVLCRKRRINNGDPVTSHALYLQASNA
ncbi:hypothetical protein R1sor_010861 [Riccia sorocarpa]|uniref:Uncharacterized protein n=1 Tax=Riccia sorocarpa TaxID=122646 RepID=A0ABD3I339_9MARC